MTQGLVVLLTWVEFLVLLRCYCTSFCGDGTDRAPSILGSAARDRFSAQCRLGIRSGSVAPVPQICGGKG